jgi:four helix bundle protein
MNNKNTSISSFEDLNCWKTCRELRQYIAKIVKQYPSDERFRLIDNMLRAARSRTHNIAEGYGRFHYQENIQFCRISRGSLYEIKDQVICSLDEGFITHSEYVTLLALIEKATTLLNGYISYLKKCIKRAN